MDRVKKCEEKFEKLFGGKPTRNEGADPEFMRILQRFIFGEVSYTGSLGDEMRELVTVTVLTVNQTLPQLKAHIGACLNIGVEPAAVREGVALPLESGETATEEGRFDEGLALQKPVYGDEIKDRYAWLPGEFAEAAPRFLTELCFGDFMTRKGLDVKTRELLTVVMLAAMGGAEVQVRSHVEGALKTGSTKEEVVCALVHAMPYMGIPRLFNALNCAKEVLSK